MKTDISRRGFFAAGAVAAAAAGLSLAGCSSSASSASASASGKGSAPANTEPMEFDITTPEIPQGELAVKANGQWLQLAENEKPFILSDTQKIKLYYVPLEPVAKALGVTCEKDDKGYLLTYGDFKVRAAAVMKDGVPFISDEFITNQFDPCGVNVTVRMTTVANADTLRTDGDNAETGQIWINLRTERPLLMHGKEGDYLFDSGEHTLDGITLHYRKATVDVNPDGQYVLVVFTHGGSARGKDNAKHLDKNRVEMLDYFAKRGQNAVCFFPQAVHGSWSYYKYVISDMLQAESKANSKIDPKRIYSLGASAGAGGAWQIADASCDWLAGLMVVAFYAETEDDHVFNAVPYDPVYLAKYENLAKVPTLIVAGGADINGVATGVNIIQKSYDHLVAAGGDAKFEIMEGLNHVGVCTQAFTDEHLDWLFSHVHA